LSLRRVAASTEKLRGTQPPRLFLRAELGDSIGELLGD
jgi:hypothetical protein